MFYRILKKNESFCYVSVKICDFLDEFMFISRIYVGRLVEYLVYFFFIVVSELVSVIGV